MPADLSWSGEAFGTLEMTEYIEPSGTAYGALREAYGSILMAPVGKKTVSERSHDHPANRAKQPLVDLPDLDRTLDSTTAYGYPSRI